MKSINFCILFVLLFSHGIIGCNKNNSESPENFLVKIEGIYSGTMNTGGNQKQAYMIVTSESESSNARLKLSRDNIAFEDLGYSFVIGSSNGNTITITNSTAPYSYHGSVDGNTLSFYMGNDLFSGTKIVLSKKF